MSKIIVALLVGVVIGGSFFVFNNGEHKQIQEQKNNLSIKLDLSSIKNDKQLKGEEKIDISNIDNKEDVVLLSMKTDFQLGIYESPWVEGFSNTVCYFEIKDKNGKILNDIENSKIRLDGKENEIFIEIKKPIVENKLFINVYGKNSSLKEDVLLGKKEIKL